MKKRLLILMLAAALTLSLTACGKSEAATAVDEQISAIGTVTLDSERAIAAAEAALAGLSENDAKQVEGKDALTAARAAYEQMVQEEEARQLEAAAKQVSDAIAAIGAVTLDSEGAIEAAQAAYDAAPSEVQALVGNFGDLDTARNTLSQLRADEVSALISAIGEVSLDSKEAVEAAQAAYENLSSGDQAKVANAGDLEAADAKLKELKLAEGMRLLENMKKEEDRVRSMSFYYPKAYPEYIDTRCYVLPYLGQDSQHTWLRLMFDYTGDDWVFFKKVLFNIDGELSTRTFTYRDIVHDNDYGVVWEYIDVEGEPYIDLLWKVADSTETIVRFEGDNYTHDFTVKSTDKDAIREVLTAYEAFN